MTQAKEDMRDMNLLFYSTVTDGAGERLLRVIEEVVPAEKTEIYRTIDTLTRRLRQPAHHPTIAVLFAASRQDLLEIASIKELIWNLRIILILPDREKDTIAKGHTLRPRFLTYSNSDFADVAAVLRKMLGNVSSSDEAHHV
jgi:hypothetical protein